MRYSKVRFEVISTDTWIEVMEKFRSELDIFASFVVALPVVHLLFHCVRLLEPFCYWSQTNPGIGNR